MFRRLIPPLVTIAALMLVPLAAAKELFDVTRVFESGSEEYSLIGRQIFFRGTLFSRFDLDSEKIVRGDSVGNQDIESEFVSSNGVILTVDDGYMKVLSPETLRVQQKTALPNREKLAYTHLAAENGFIFVAANYVVNSTEMFEEDALQGILYCFQGQEMVWRFVGAVGEYFYTPIPFEDKVILPGSCLHTLDSKNGGIVSRAPQKGANGIRQSGGILWIPAEDSLIQYDLNAHTIRKTSYRFTSSSGTIFAPPYIDANHFVLATSYTAFWGSPNVGTACRLALFRNGGQKLWEKSIPAEVNFQPVIYKNLLFVPVNYLNGSKDGRMLVYDLKGNLIRKLYPQQYGWPGTPIVYQDRLYMIGGGGIFRVKVN